MNSSGSDVAFTFVQYKRTHEVHLHAREENGEATSLFNGFLGNSTCY